MLGGSGGNWAGRALGSTLIWDHYGKRTDERCKRTDHIIISLSISDCNNSQRRVSTRTSLPPPTAKQKNSRTQKHISTQSGTMQKPPLATQSFLHWQPMPTTTSPQYDNTKQREKQEPLSCKIWLHHVLLRSLPSTPPPLWHSSLLSRTKHPSFANPPLRSPIVIDRKIIKHSS